MSHSPELIQRILNLVQQDYPASQYSVIIEKAIPGTRMHPDILIRDMDGNAVCAVEIGYTRPEKLTAYRDELKIPDVRWYDNKEGKLHADVKERVVRVTIDVPPPQHRFVLYNIGDYICCRSDECLEEAKIECALGLAEHHGIETGNEEDSNFMDTVCKQIGVKWDEDPDIINEVDEHLQMYTTLWVATDYSRILFDCFCDKCGDYWTASESDNDDLWAIANELRTVSAREFAAHWGARVWEGGWGGKIPYQLALCDIWATPYQDWDFLSPDDKQQFHRTLNTIRRETMLETGA